jgi:rubrerythrin
VDEYKEHDNLGLLFDGVRTLAGETTAEDMIEATKPFRDLPEVVIPAFEAITAQRPDDAQSLVILANAYWLTGRGPQAVGKLASRAIEIDAENRGAWHLCALSESDPRARMERWREVTLKFPADQLARAALADNATSVAGAEHDPNALELAIDTYEALLKESTNAAQRKTLRETIDTLKKWNL